MGLGKSISRVQHLIVVLLDKLSESTGTRLCSVQFRAQWEVEVGRAD